LARDWQSVLSVMKIRLQKSKINTTRARFAAALAASVALAVSPAVHATAYTSTVVADGSGSDVVLEAGDTVTVATGYGLDVKNDAVITATGIAVNVGTEGMPETTAQVGVYINTGQVNLGSGSVITVHGNGGTAHGLIGSNATITAIDGLIIKVTNSGDSNGGGGVMVGGGSTDLGTGAWVEANQEALEVSWNGKIKATDGTFRGTGANGEGIHVTGGTIELADSEVWGEKYAIGVYSQTGASLPNNIGNVTLSGGTVSSGTDTLIKGVGNTATNPTAVTVTFKDGAKAASAAGGNGFLYQADAGVSVASAVSVVIDGESTAVAGRFLDGDSASSLTVSDGATWTSTGASVADNLTLDNANVQLTLDSLTDTITATGTLTLAGTNTLTTGLTNQALQEIVNGSGNGTCELDATALITGSALDDSGGTGRLEYSVLNYNDAGSTWTVDELGDGRFRISGITISAVPEPAAWAALAGVVLLAVAMLRRRRA
jgi:hypothetical protein